MAVDSIISIIFGLFFPLLIIISFMIFIIKRSNRKKLRKQQEKVLIMQQSQRNYDNTTQHSINLDNLIKQFDPSNQNIDRAINGFQFDVPINHIYSLFEKIKVVQQNNKNLKMFTTLRKSFPTALDIRKRRSSQGLLAGEFQIPRLSSIFHLFSPAPAIWENILNQAELVNLLLKMGSNIEYMFVQDNYFEALVRQENTILNLLEFIIHTHNQMIGLFTDLDSYDVEQLLCYNCGDPYDPMEEICDKCGASRPRCLICLLDLKPSEKQEVVTHPCCQVYSHKNHIIAWLNQNPSCPNCHQNLGHWLRKLKLL